MYRERSKSSVTPRRLFSAASASQHTVPLEATLSAGTGVSLPAGPFSAPGSPSSPCTVPSCGCPGLRPHHWFKGKCYCNHLVSEHLLLSPTSTGSSGGIVVSPSASVALSSDSLMRPDSLVRPMSADVESATLSKTPPTKERALSAADAPALELKMAPESFASDDGSVVSLSKAVDAVVRTKGKEEGGKAFSENLIGHVVPALAQLREGKRMARRMKKVHEDLLKCYRDFAFQVDRIVSEEITSLMSVIPDPRLGGESPSSIASPGQGSEDKDEMKTVWENWIMVLNGHKKIAAVTDKFAEDSINYVIRPMDVTYERSKKAQTDLETEVDRALTPINVVKNEMRKLHVKSNKLIEGVLKPSFKSKASKKKTKALEEVLEACSKYEEQVATANQYLTTFTTLQLPLILSKIQASEHHRMNATKASLQQQSSFMTSYFKNVGEISEAMKASSALIDPIGDMNRFIELCHFEYEAEVYTPFKYDLVMSARDVIEKLQQEDPTLFQRKLKDILEKQAKEERFKDLKLPRTFVALKKGVEVLGGFQTEGIFRVCAEFDEMNALAVSLENGDFDIKVTSPHVPASLLKKWLRDLEDPLIPDSLYDKAMALGKAEKLDTVGYTSLIAELPVENRLIVEGIVFMLRAVAHPTNQVINKMDLHNLGVVFGPCFLRSKSEDPAVVFENAKYANRFIVRLAECANVSDYPLEEESKLEATFTIVPRKAALPGSAGGDADIGISEFQTSTAFEDGSVFVDRSVADRSVADNSVMEVEEMGLEESKAEASNISRSVSFIGMEEKNAAAEGPDKRRSRSTFAKGSTQLPKEIEQLRAELQRGSSKSVLTGGPSEVKKKKTTMLSSPKLGGILNKGLFKKKKRLGTTSAQSSGLLMAPGGVTIPSTSSTGSAGSSSSGRSFWKGAFGRQPSGKDLGVSSSSKPPSREASAEGSPVLMASDSLSGEAPKSRTSVSGR